MSDFIRAVGSTVIALILVSIPGLLVASIAYEWPCLLKILFCWATVSECLVTMWLIYERSGE